MPGPPRAMLYPNRLQTTLLFDRREQDLDAIMRDFTRIEGMRTGANFHVSDHDPGRFARLFDASDELMVTLEYVGRPADTHLFHKALSSAYTGMNTPDIRQRLNRTESHILFEVSHGAVGTMVAMTGLAATPDPIGETRAGASQIQFARRLSVLALLSRIAIDHAMPLAVHWTQSDLLLSGEHFDALAANPDAPGPLHIHPFLSGPEVAADEQGLVGIRTHGARHWLGREIIVQPNVLPWAANLETIFAFLRTATGPDGYVIPDGDTFGSEDRSMSYRVIHHDAGAQFAFGESADEQAHLPLYELLPMKHLADDLVVPDHLPGASPCKTAGDVDGKREVPVAGGPPRPPIALAPSRPGSPALTGRGLRTRVFGRKAP